MKKLQLLSVIVILSMMLGACVTAAPSPTAPAATAAPTAVPLGKVLKIGMITVQTGAYAIYGVAQERGFMIGLEYASGGKKDANGNYIIAGRPVQVIKRDTEANADKAASMARALIEQDGVEILQGGTVSADALAVIPIATATR